MDRMIIEHDLKMAFDDGYQAGLEAAAPKWISVEERLPEHLYDACLIFADGFIEVATWALDKYKMCTWFFVDGEYETGVTHWMPLPKPPEEELNEEKQAEDWECADEAERIQVPQERYGEI